MAIFPEIFDANKIPRRGSYDSLPDMPAIAQLKSRNQWVAWKYADRGGPKPTKPPIRADNGMPASVGDPKHWASYQQAVMRATRANMAGVGYVLSPDDNLTGIDLDNCRDPETGDLAEWAKEIVDLAETYCEVSPSETGLRIIAEGKVSAAMKLDAAGVEIYGKARYLTITGWHLHGTPQSIRPAPRTLAALESRIEALRPARRESAKAAERRPVTPSTWQGDTSDPFRAVNDAALANLDAWVPDIFGSAARFQAGTGAYRIPSRALGRNLQEDLSIAPNGIVDWGVHDMGDPRDGARTPIDLVQEFGKEANVRDAAMWLCGRLGRDPADFGFDQGSRNGAISAANLRRVVRLENGSLKDAETGSVIEAPQVPSGEDYPEEKLRVGGLVGDIADWIMSTSMFPCRLFATAAALSIIGVAVARQVYTGVPRTGTSLYWLTIAPTAGGKERPQEAIRQILNAAGIARLAKPSYASAAKLGMSLNESPAQIQIIDEVGKVLRRFVSRHASSQELALLDDYCTIWGKNTGAWSPEGVTVRSDVMIQRPSLSFFGATTPTAFYEQLRAKQVAGGFLNRFLVMQRFTRVEANEGIVPDDEVPQHIVDAVRALNTFQDGSSFPMPSVSAADMYDMPPPLFVVPASPDGQAALDEYRAKAWQMILRADDDPILEIYARSAEMVKRMALILACGRHWQDMRRCEIRPEDVSFAAGLVDWSMATFVDGLRANMAENDHQANMKEVVSIIRRAGQVKRMHLIKRLDGKMDARTLDSVIKLAIESGDVEEAVEETAKKGRPARIYIYAGGGK